MSMYEVMAVLKQHAGNNESFAFQKHAEETAGFLAAAGVPCVVRKQGTILIGGRAALAETARRANRGEILVQNWMLKAAPGLGLRAGKWLK